MKRSASVGAPAILSHSPWSSHSVPPGKECPAADVGYYVYGNGDGYGDGYDDGYDDYGYYMLGYSVYLLYELLRAAMSLSASSVTLLAVTGPSIA